MSFKFDTVAIKTLSYEAKQALNYESIQNLLCENEKLIELISKLIENGYVTEAF
ncbi:hypothetical protein A3Q56_07871, partial [Intoshia linei]